MSRSPEQSPTCGTLTLVATPIGNLEDITLRALRVLREAHLIAAEDTRRTAKLLAHFGISCPTVSCHAHNEKQRLPGLLRALQSGRNVALVSDAGTPGISDPGYRIVRRAAELGLPITAVPGPSAAIMALCLSGFPADRFTFYGFLPRAGKHRRLSLEEAAGVPHTLVFFEAPHRIEKTLRDLQETLGDRESAMCRELTKRYEEVRRGPLSALLDENREGSKKRGEYCIVVQGREPSTQLPCREDRLEMALEALSAYKDTPLKEASRQIADRFGLSRRDVYQAALRQDEPETEP